MKLSVLTCKIKHYLAHFRVVFFVWLIMAIIPWLRKVLTLLYYKMLQ